MTELKVREAYTRDIGRSVARIDYDTMDKLGVATGDYALVTCNKTTVLKVMPLYPSDEGKEMVRIDGMDRHNSGSNIGSVVALEKTEIVVAEKVIFKPLEAIPPIDDRYLSDSLDNIPVMKGKVVMVPYFGGKISFEVVKTVPDKPVLIVDRKTITEINIDTVGGKLNETEEIILKEIEILKKNITEELINAKNPYTILRTCATYSDKKSKLEEALKLIRSL